MNILTEQLRGLSLRPDETWQGAAVRLPMWITVDVPKPYRPHAVLWVAVEAHTIYPPELCRSEEMNASRVLASLVKFATNPNLGGYLPGRIEVRDPALAEDLRGALSELGVEVAHVENLEFFDLALAGLAEAVDDRPDVPGLLSGEGVTLDAVRRFAEAAEAFFRAAPWKHLTDEDLIEIDSPDAPEDLSFISVLGAARRSFGLSFFSDPEDCWDIRRMGDHAEWSASREECTWTLSFNDVTEIVFADSDLWEDHHLPLAGELAYPSFIGFMPDETFRRPTAALLSFAEGLLRALSQTTEEQIDSGRWTIDVETAAGLMQVTLALPDLLQPPSCEELMDRGFEPDRRAMEKMHTQMERFFDTQRFNSIDEMKKAVDREFVGKPYDATRFPPRNALEQAQELCYQAFDTIGRRQVQLARKALEICSDCADAYVLMAGKTGDPKEAVELFAKGVAAGERALGNKAFEEGVGHFWGITSTRPYMRARFGLAECLEALGRETEAAEHYRDMLRLNPKDNQGARYRYLPLMMKLGFDAEAARYMKSAPDEETANWAYTRALLAYRVGGQSTSARTELRAAIRINPHVVPCLLAETSAEGLPDSYSLGSREEAEVCASELRNAFAATPGATEWLEAEAQRHRRDRRKQERERAKKKR